VADAAQEALLAHPQVVEHFRQVLVAAVANESDDAFGRCLLLDCHLVDLEPMFQGEHFAADNIHADTAGGVIIGDAWWKTMQQNCIAQ
jgi:hypothetical protein